MLRNFQKHKPTFLLYTYSNYKSSPWLSSCWQTQGFLLSGGKKKNAANQLWQSENGKRHKLGTLDFANISYSTNGEDYLQERMWEHPITIIIVIITGLLISSTEFVAGGSLTRSTPLNWTCQNRGRSISFHIVCLLCRKDETCFGGRSFVFRCLRWWHNGNRTFVFFYPSIIIPHNIFMV